MLKNIFFKVAYFTERWGNTTTNEEKGSWRQILIKSLYREFVKSINVNIVTTNFGTAFGTKIN